MNTSRNKLLSVLAIILLTSGIASIAVASAHSPAIYIPTFTYAYAAPNPIGVGQPTTFVYYLNVPPPDAASNAAIRWNWTLTVTDPNGHATNLGMFLSDVNGLGSTTFTPTIAGTWQLTATFPDTNYTFSSTATQQLYTNDLFQSSTYTANFTVQSEPVVIPATALPTDYWSGALQGNWFQIINNNYGTNAGQNFGNHQAIIDQCTGSLTAHMLWVIPCQAGGQVGGKDTGAVQGNGFYQGLAYNSRFLYTQPIIILDGMMYYKQPLGNSGSGGNYVQLDMRTGQIMQYSNVGTLGMGYSANGVTCLFSSSSFGTPRDPVTMQPLPWTVTGAPTQTGASTTGARVGANGEIYRFILANVNGTNSNPGIWNVEQWNSSRVFVPGMSGTVNAGLASAYDFNTTITLNNAVWVPPTPAGATSAVTPRLYYYQLNQFALLTNMTPAGTGTGAAFQRNDTWVFWTVSLQPGTVGQIIATTSFYRNAAPLDQVLPVPNISVSGDLAQFNEAFDPVSHVIPLWSLRTLEWFGLNTLTGTVWGPSLAQDAFDYYAAPDNTAYNRDSFGMNGYLFEASWAGQFYCYNATTGERLYSYGLGGFTLNANASTAGFYTLYNGYPQTVPEITKDNDLAYCYVNEHSPNVPELKNSYLHCINITNGHEEFMTSTYGGVWTTAVGMELVGNGYTVELNAHNMLIQCEGLGPSATTVQATNNTVVGDKMIIEGSVIDTSPGTKQLDLAGRFPNGVPCVQEGDNMTQWMEYLYMHHEPRPDVQGVDVTLIATDSSGTSTEIGTVKTDSTGYYSFLYTPSTAGTYGITAAFKGSTAYAPSTAMSTVNIASVPPTATPSPTPTPAGVSNDTYVLGSTAAIIVVIAIVTVVIALMLRKKP